MKKIFLILLIITASLQALSAADSSMIDDPALQQLLEAQRLNNQAYAANEAYLETGELQYDISKSILSPQIDADLTGAGTNSFLSRTPAEPPAVPEDIEVNNNYALSISPELSISQLLPTSGILNGSITNTVSAAGIEESSVSDDVPFQEIEWNNKLDFTLGISQPLFFGNAYDASVTSIKESLEITKIRYLDNRNALISSAVADYYDLIQTSYQKKLVEKRLETNQEYEKRMIREHELGMWTQGQLNTAMAVRLQSEADLLKASQTNDSIREKIKALYGIEADSLPRSSDIIEFQFSKDDIDLLNTEILSANPEILIKIKSIMLADSDIVIEEKNAAPILTAGGSYSLLNGITEESFSDSLSFSLSFAMPVTDGGSSSKTIAMKKNEAARLRNDLNDQQKRTLSQLQGLVNNLSVSKKLSEIYRLQEEAAAFDFDRGTKELELGGITSKELLDLQITLENARLSIIVNKIEYNLTVLQIYRLLGIDLRLLTGTQEGADR